MRTRTYVIAMLAVGTAAATAVGTSPRQWSLPEPGAIPAVMKDLGYQPWQPPPPKGGPETAERRGSVTTGGSDRSPLTGSWGQRQRVDGPGPDELRAAADRQLWSYAPGGKVAPGLAVQVTVWTVANAEPGRTVAVVTEICGTVADGLDRAGAMARAMGGPPTESLLREAWAEAVAAPSGRASRDHAANIRVTVDRSNDWRLTGLAPAVPVLMAALKAEDGRDGVALRLGEIGLPAQAALIEALADAGRAPGVRAGAAVALGAIRTEPAAKALLALLQAKEQQLRVIAVEALAGQEPALVEADILKAARDADPYVQAAALRTMRKQGLKDEKAIAVLAGLLSQPAPGGEEGSLAPRRWALACAIDLGPQARALVPGVRNVMGSSKEWMRVEAARLLWTLEKDADGTVPALLAEIVEDRGGKGRFEARELIGKMGAAARPALERAAKGTNPDIAKAAREILKSPATP